MSALAPSWMSRAIFAIFSVPTSCFLTQLAFTKAKIKARKTAQKDKKTAEENEKTVQEKDSNHESDEKQMDAASNQKPTR